MEKRPPVWMLAANILNEQSRTAEICGPQAVCVPTDCLLCSVTERAALKACICRDITWELWNWGQRWRRSCSCFRMWGVWLEKRGWKL